MRTTFCSLAALHGADLVDYELVCMRPVLFLVTGTHTHTHTRTNAHTHTIRQAGSFCRLSPSRVGLQQTRTSRETCRWCHFLQTTFLYHFLQLLAPFLYLFCTANKMTSSFCAFNMETSLWTKFYSLEENGAAEDVLGVSFLDQLKDQTQRESFEQPLNSARLGPQREEETWGCLTGVCWCFWPQQGLSVPSASWPSPWERTIGCTPEGCAALRPWATTRRSARTKRSWPTPVCGGPAAQRVGVTLHLHVVSH